MSGGATRWLGNAAAAARGGRPPFAFCYHGVGDVGPEGDPHGLMLPVEAFVAHLDYLASRGTQLVTVDELWRRVGSAEGARGFGALTIDDGLAHTMETVTALLTARGLLATVYLPTGLLGRPHPHLPGDERIVDRSQVLDLAAAGLQIGAHSVDHPDLRLLADAELQDQLRRSRETLEDLLGQGVTSMAYPFGSYDARVIGAVREAGYETACASSGAGPWRALELPREPIYPRTTPVRLRLKAAGVYGPARAAGRLRNRLAGRRGTFVIAEDRRAGPRTPG